MDLDNNSAFRSSLASFTPHTKYIVPLLMPSATNMPTTEKPKKALGWTIHFFKQTYRNTVHTAIENQTISNLVWILVAQINMNIKHMVYLNCIFKSDWDR